MECERFWVGQGKYTFLVACGTAQPDAENPIRNNGVTEGIDVSSSIIINYGGKPAANAWAFKTIDRFYRNQSSATVVSLLRKLASKNQGIIHAHSEVLFPQPAQAVSKTVSL